MASLSPVYSPALPSPNYIAHPAIVTFPAVGDTTRTANTTYLHDVYVPATCVLTAFSVAHGTVSAGNIDLGIYDVSGNLVTHTGVTAVTGVGTLQKIVLTTPVILAPGVYFLAFWTDSATSTYFARQALTPVGAWGNILNGASTNAGGLLANFAAMGGTVLVATCMPILGNVQSGL